MKKFNLLFTAAFMAVATVGFAQVDSDVETHALDVTVPDVLLVDVEGASGNTATITFVDPIEAGTALDATADTLWLNYTSVIPTGVTRKITAGLSATSPAGVTLTLRAGASNFNGSGTTGTVSSSTQTLSTSPVDFVTGIGSCWTADGENNGVELIYDASITDYASLEAALTNLTVTYTIVNE